MLIGAHSHEESGKKSSEDEEERSSAELDESEEKEGNEEQVESREEDALAAKAIDEPIKENPEEEGRHRVDAQDYASPRLRNGLGLDLLLERGVVEGKHKVDSKAIGRQEQASERVFLETHQVYFNFK